MPVALLSLSLLGPFQVSLAGQPLTGFESNKVRALLAYLAVEAERPRARETVAGLFWPEVPEQTARANLRHALTSLRRTLSDGQRQHPFLLTSNQTIQFNPQSDFWLDVTHFSQIVAAADPTRLDFVDPVAEAVALYQGQFLEGFSLKGSPAFEEWLLLWRERLDRQAVEACQYLADCHERQGNYEAARLFVRRQLELEPWREPAHRQLMRLLALSGLRNAALVQYETCRRILLAELGVEVTPETRLLSEQIRAGQIGPEVAGPVTGTLVTGSASPAAWSGFFRSRPLPPLVARERQLAQLDRLLGQALAGQGGVVFVTGDAGSGKTALIQAFARRAQQRQPELLVAGGHCNAYSGLGDPYLPFRQILELLTGDFEVRWALEAMTEPQAQALWDLFPLIVQSLVRTGPDLVGTFVSSQPLLARASAYAAEQESWFEPLQQLVERPQAQPGAPSPEQGALFEQVARLLRAVARSRPLVLVVDDLQWADTGSVSLLFHLGRQVSGERILLVGAFRPEEVSVGRAGARHPLQPVLHELRLAWGDITVALDQGADPAFVPAYLACEPNRLDEPFQARLYQLSRGHPLFTIELLREMRERGQLVRDETGHWVESPTLVWTSLPARVEAAIAERLGRLPPDLRQALNVASVEGETFTAEVVAQVQGVAAHPLVRQFSEVLAQQHYLVSSQGSRRVGRHRLSTYQFRHILFQTYLYHSLTEAQRAYLHEEVGLALERLHGPQREEWAGELARHFEAAGLTEQAIPYFRQAGDRAVRLSAHEVAIDQYQRGLALLKQGPDTPRLELGLLLALSTPLMALKGYAAFEVAQVQSRAQALFEQLSATSPNAPELFPAILSAWHFHFAQGDYHAAKQWAEQALAWAKASQDPLSLAKANEMLGFVLLLLGKFTPALAYYDDAIATSFSPRHAAAGPVLAYNPKLMSLSYSAFLLCSLGYPDQAARRSQQAITLARALAQPFDLVHALGVTGFVHMFRAEWQVVQAFAEEGSAISAEQAFPYWLGVNMIAHGRALLEHSSAEQGVARIREGLSSYKQAAGLTFQSIFLFMLAEAYAKLGDVAAGLSTLEQAFEHIQKTDERFCEAELYRLKGELLLKANDKAGGEAEACFHQATEVARLQEAKWWELRATVSLARLWQRQERQVEARQRLAAIYDWFTEGLDTADLQEAKQLLDALAAAGS